MRRLLLSLSGAMLFSASAMAADMPVKAKPLDLGYNWTGFFIGGHAGYGWTTQGMSAADRAALTATYGAVPSPKGFIGGLHAHYNYQLANRVVLGVGLEINGFGIDAFNNTTGLAGASTLKSSIDWDVALFARVGYAFDRFMPYVLFGGDWTRNKVTGANGFIGAFAVTNWHTGWTLGGGVEAPIADRWTGRVQFRYVDSSSQTYLNRLISGTGSVVDVGVSYRF